MKADAHEADGCGVDADLKPRQIIQLVPICVFRVHLLSFA